MPHLHIDKISLTTFNATLSRYADTAPSALVDLDRLRYTTVPSKLAKSNTDAFLQKSDVEKLVEWKLKHGTYRPALMGLVKSNAADLVKATTREAFTSLTRSSADVVKAVKILTKLRGIGPATASLLLSVYAPDEVPFFSDELFRWTHWDEKGRTGWGRPIKYNMTEYKEVVARVEVLRGRLGVGAVDAEKVAYVLGKERVDVDRDGEDEVDEKLGEELGGDKEAAEAAAGAAANMDNGEAKEDALNGGANKVAKEKKDEKDRKQEDKAKDGVAAELESLRKEAAKPAMKKGTKRKAQEVKTLAEEPRRSTRKKP